MNREKCNKSALDVAYCSSYFQICLKTFVHFPPTWFHLNRFNDRRNRRSETQTTLALSRRLAYACNWCLLVENIVPIDFRQEGHRKFLRFVGREEDGRELLI